MGPVGEAQRVPLAEHHGQCQDGVAAEAPQRSDPAVAVDEHKAAIARDNKNGLALSVISGTTPGDLVAV